jgi:hypothetical protein
MKNPVFAWLRLWWSKSVRLAFASGVTIILYAALLYIVNLCWMLYIETPLGKRFLALQIIDIGTVEGLQAENFLELSIEVSLTVVTVCLVFGAVSQVFLLIRYLYEGRGLWYRFMMWGIPCIALTAAVISRTYGIGPVASSLLALPPTMVLFPRCLRYPNGLLPDISTVIAGIATLPQKRLRKERRAEPRYDMSLALAYRGPKSSGVYRSRASQISNHGFRLRKPKDLVNGDIIRFTLKIEDCSILGEAMIKWTKGFPPDGGKEARISRSGCRIVFMATKDQAALKDFLSRHSLEGA